MSKRFSIRVPATSANLGCLFDCAAIAYGLYLTVHVTPHTPGESKITYRGVTPERIPTDETNLIARTIRQTLASWGKTRGFDLEIDNMIPVGAGLGSSAAAIVAALAASHVLADRVLLDEELIGLAAKIEGHPDNAAAAWLGGFTISTQADDRVFSLSCPVPEHLKLVLVIPDYPVPTEKARQVLPDNYSRADAVHNLQRGAMVVARFFSGMADLNRCLFDDRWHQPYRTPLMPGLQEVLNLRSPGLLGVCLSGAGPSILALARENASAIGESIQQVLNQFGVKSEISLLSPDNKGAKGWNLPD
ncbi:MAG: homoserine kinase [Acidobacteriota bacterium]|nr:homoserine kinase [Acidobacteriota bacterium]